MADPAPAVKISPAASALPGREPEARAARPVAARLDPLDQLTGAARDIGSALAFQLRTLSARRPLTLVAAVGVISFAAGAALRIWRSRRYG